MRVILDSLGEVRLAAMNDWDVIYTVHAMTDPGPAVRPPCRPDVRGLLCGLLLGSTSRALVHHPPCPLAVVRTAAR